MSHEDALFDRIVRLERRLDTYHEQLEQALEHDRERQLSIAWGFTDYVAFFGAVFFTVWLARQILGEVSGLAFAVVFFVAFGGGIAALMVAHKAQAEQLRRMSRLPNWDSDSRAT